MDLSELLTQLKAFQTKQDEKYALLQRQIDGIEVRGARPGGAGGGAPESGLIAFTKKLGEGLGDLNRNGRLRFEIPTLLERKTITSTGLYAPQAATGVAGEGKFPYMLRTLFGTVEATTGSVFVLRTTAESTPASPQTSEGALKSESTFTFEGESMTIPTLASFVILSRQAMDDVPALPPFLRGTLLHALERECERQLLLGSGSGANMQGLTIAAATFDTSILDAANGFNIVDCIGAGTCQLQESGFAPDFAVMHPRDWYRAQALKDSTGQYVFGAPRTAVGRQVWDLSSIVVSDQMTAGHFLVGDSSQATLRQRQTATVDVSYEDSDNFRRNLCTIRAEERVLLQINREEAFVYGSLTSSPA